MLVKETLKWSSRFCFVLFFPFFFSFLIVRNLNFISLYVCLKLVILNLLILLLACVFNRDGMTHLTCLLTTGTPWKWMARTRTSTPSCWNGQKATHWPWGLLSRVPTQWSVSWVTRAVWTTSRLVSRASTSPCRPLTSLSCLASGPGPSSWPASATDQHH